MATPSARLGLSLDADTDPIEAMRTQFTRIDQAMPVMWVNDGVVPSDAVLYDGAVVGELTSGKMWVAHKNIGGTFDHNFIRYPYNGNFTTLAGAIPSTTVFASWGWNAFSALGSKGASLSDINGSSFWVCPQKGIWHFRSWNQWDANTTGNRGSVMRVNGVNDINNTWINVNACTLFQTNVVWSKSIVLNTGDIVGQQVYQNSGGNLNVYVALEATMVTPL